MYLLELRTTEDNKPQNNFFRKLEIPASFENTAEFNHFCRQIIGQWKEENPSTSASKEFSAYLEAIEKGGNNIIQTPWGGVYIVKHHHPDVEKYLVVKSGCYLSFEKHSEKIEHLEVITGKGIILERKEGVIAVQPAEIGFKTTFQPGVEHCIIALENMLVLEKSQDFKGMDQDLIFIYEPQLPYSTTSEQQEA